VKITILPPPNSTLSDGRGSDGALGGIETACLELGDALVDRGHEVRIAGRFGRHRKAQALDWAQVAASDGDALISCNDARVLQAGDFNLETKELDALCAILNPITAALKVILDTTHQIARNARQLAIIDLIDQITEPLAGLLYGRILATSKRFAIEGDCDGAVWMLDLEEIAIGIVVEGVATHVHSDFRIVALNSLRRVRLD
jgi:hypothetical protein